MLGLKDSLLKEIKCYEVYGLKGQCPDCPFVNKSVTRSYRKTGEKNVSVFFNLGENFLVESIRDVTKEVYLIDEIKKQQAELEERQRQMSLLNADL